MQTRLTVVLLASWLAGFCGTGIAVAQSRDVAVVVNAKNPARSLSRAEVRQIFIGEKRTWSGGTPIRLFVRAPGARERVILLKVLGMTESEYKQYWTAQVFRGEAQSEPLALYSNGMQREAVLAFPGAVALVSIEDVKPGMKVLKVDGLAPGDPGYPINETVTFK